MAGLSFIEFSSKGALEKFCKENSYILSKHKFLYAEVRDKKNILWGYVSERPQDYRCKKSSTKYVLVWE